MSSPDSGPRKTVSAASGPDGAIAVPVRVWDLPLRLFHWLLVLCLVGSFVTINVGGNWTNWHFRFGYTALGLILFRVLWGVVGPRYARFSSFIFSPRAIVAYLRNAPGAPRTLGHNPPGALSVFTLLAAIGFQATAGLFTSDDIFMEGPLARLVSNAVVEQVSRLHQMNKWVILGLVGLHLLAILYYRVFRRQSLVKPMVVGDKLVAPEATLPDPAVLAAQDNAATRWRALVVVAVAAITVTVVVNWPIF